MASRFQKHCVLHLLILGGVQVPLPHTSAHALTFGRTNDPFLQKKVKLEEDMIVDKSQDGLSFERAQEESQEERQLRKNVVLEAVRQNGLALEFAVLDGFSFIERLEILRAAVRQNGLAVQYAHLERVEVNTIAQKYPACVKRLAKAYQNDGYFRFSDGDVVMRAYFEVFIAALAENSETSKYAPPQNSWTDYSLRIIELFKTIRRGGKVRFPLGGWSKPYVGDGRSLKTNPFLDDFQWNVLNMDLRRNPDVMMLLVKQDAQNFFGYKAGFRSGVDGDDAEFVLKVMKGNQELVEQIKGHLHTMRECFDDDDSCDGDDVEIDLSHLHQRLQDSYQEKTNSFHLELRGMFPPTESNLDQDNTETVHANFQLPADRDRDTVQNRDQMRRHSGDSEETTE